MKKSVFRAVTISIVMIFMFAMLVSCNMQGPAGPTGQTGPKGDDGRGVLSIIKTATDGLVDTYTITYTDNNTSVFTVKNGANGEQGIQGIQGEKGDDGHTPIITIQNGNWYIDGVDSGKAAEGIQGEAGKGISSIDKSSSVGLVDVYTITYTNGSTSAFMVTNGADGEQGIQGIQGEKGDDGHTPVITIQDGYWYIDGVNTTKSATGLKGDTGKGISSITKTKMEGLVDTYTIIFTDSSTTTFTVTNGAEGKQGIQGIQGQKGDDGHTPVITIQNGYWYIDGVNTTKSATGLEGKAGNGISSVLKTKTEGLVDTYTITFTNGDTTTFTVTNGAQGIQGIQGIQGEPGEAGKAPSIIIKNGKWNINGIDTGIFAEGVNGDDGLSAFEIYKKYHPEYEGTEAEWIESLKGAQGASVSNAYVDESLHLWLVLTDGTKINAGYVGVSTIVPTPDPEPDPDITEPTIVVSSAEASAGATDVEITVALKNNPGVTSMLMKIAFDDSALDLVSMTYNTTIGGTGIPLQSNASPITAYWAEGFNDVAGDWTFVTLKFSVANTAAAGEYDITVSYNADDVYNVDEVNVDFDVINGKITVS